MSGAAAAGAGRRLEHQRVLSGEVIVRQGDSGDCLYVARSGAVEVTSDRRRITLLGDGNSFGEVAVLSQAKRSATVRALEPTDLLVLQRDTFEAVLRDH